MAMTDDKTREALIAELADALDWTWEAEPPHVPSAHDVLVDVVDRLATRFCITERSADPSEAAVEAAARSIYIDDGYESDWYEESETEQGGYRRIARAALTAARVVEETGRG